MCVWDQDPCTYQLVEYLSLDPRVNLELNNVDLIDVSCEQGSSFFTLRLCLVYLVQLILIYFLSHNIIESTSQTLFFVPAEYTLQLRLFFYYFTQN
jgi:hypothetical protein